MKICYFADALWTLIQARFRYTKELTYIESSDWTSSHQYTLEMLIRWYSHRCEIRSVYATSSSVGWAGLSLALIVSRLTYRVFELGLMSFIKCRWVRLPWKSTVIILVRVDSHVSDIHDPNMSGRDRVPSWHFYWFVRTLFSLAANALFPRI